MDYAACYWRLIHRAINRSYVFGYKEKHHIIPICIGGRDVKQNIVELTAEEHFLAHKLLVKMYPFHDGLLWSAVCMTNGNKTMSGRSKNKLYGHLRKNFSAMISRTGRGPHSEETKLKMSKASKGVSKSESHKASLSISKTGKKIKKYTEERLAALRLRQHVYSEKTSKIKSKEAHEIICLSKTKTRKEIADIYGISVGYVGEIITGRKKKLVQNA